MRKIFLEFERKQEYKPFSNPADDVMNDIEESVKIILLSYVKEIYYVQQRRSIGCCLKEEYERLG